MAAMAGWSKNEGLLFGLVVLGIQAVQAVRVRGWRSAAAECRSFLVGAAPVLGCLLWFKIRFAPANDLLSGQGLVTASRFAEAERYAAVAGGFGRALLEVGAQGVLPLLLMFYLLVAGLAPGEAARRAARVPVLVLGLMIVGYAVTLLAAPAPLLDTNVRSINRLLLQLLPSALLAFFLAVRTLEEGASHTFAQEPAAGRSRAGL
jgi:hypothetical protein